MSKKGNFDGLHKQTVRTYFQKRKYFLIFTKKITKKGKFDGLCKQIVGKYFQKRKLSRFFTEKIFPKKEILMDYVIISYHTQMNHTNWLCSMVTTVGFSMAYLSRLLSLTKPKPTSKPKPSLP